MLLLSDFWRNDCRPVPRKVQDNRLHLHHLRPGTFAGDPGRRSYPRSPACVSATNPKLLAVIMMQRSDLLNSTLNSHQCSKKIVTSAKIQGYFL